MDTNFGGLRKKYVRSWISCCSQLCDKYPFNF